MNIRRVLGLPILGGLLFSVGCAGMQVQDYADVQPEFDPITFFNGELVAEGVVQNRSGKVTRHFVATIDAYWDEERGVLDEVFLFSDGEESERYWEFTRTGPNTWSGTAGDVVGESRLVHAGNAIQMRYRLSVPLSSGRNVVLNMDDWLYQVSEETLINETVMRKFGFRVGKLILTIRKLD